MSKNKKILNATSTIQGNIQFKSLLEKTIYNTLIQNNINPSYEGLTFTLFEGFIPITPFYDQESPLQQKQRLVKGDTSIGKQLILKNKKIISIKYTPDFYFKHNNIDVYIETKGKENDVFYIKKKLFISYLDNKFLKTGVQSIYFEIRTKKQLLQALNILNSYGIQKPFTTNRTTNS